MDITLLVESFVGLASLLGVLIFFLFYAPAKKREKELQKVQEKKRVQELVPVDFNTLLERVRDKHTSTKELAETLETILREYGEIDDIKPYSEILIRICRHPNTDKNIILNFNRGLEQKNPNYSREINSFIAQGLNSR